MKKYFERRNVKIATPDISKIKEFRESLLVEMEKMGATKGDFDLVCDAIIINAINNGRKAEDVAWAILQ